MSPVCPPQVTTGEIRLVNADSHQKCFTRGALDWFLVRRPKGCVRERRPEVECFTGGALSRFLLGKPKGWLRGRW